MIDESSPTRSQPRTAFAALAATAVRDVATLREIYGPSSHAVQHKQVDRIHEVSRRLIGCSSFVLIGTADADGSCDVSPRGGPPGFVAVLDERTLAIPDATGNRRIDSLRNIVATGRAGLLFLVPGRNDTLRVNGRAVVCADPGLLAQLTAVGRPPRTAIVVEVEEVYGHCPKSLLRGAVWKPEQWPARDAAPSSAEVTLSHLSASLDGLTVEMIEQAEEESLRLRYE
ncbi:MSMEG_1061 family FMN-dependent PPOX-type flavoprotein [Kitasatospora sp. NPDC052896]|uniref:MSMEG_1061 family FMN-dependent PPOX-type flavoprotein n=1 Tax=Kitasatospora sp. NPDC052896 TaxID=3364061 RepID=UPI0037CA0D69